MPRGPTAPPGCPRSTAAGPRRQQRPPLCMPGWCQRRPHRCTGPGRWCCRSPAAGVRAQGLGPRGQGTGPGRWCCCRWHTYPPTCTHRQIPPPPPPHTRHCTCIFHAHIHARTRTRPLIPTCKHPHLPILPPPTHSDPPHECNPPLPPPHDSPWRTRRAPLCTG